VEQLDRESRASECFDACEDRGCHFGRFAKGHHSNPRRGLTKEGHRPRRLRLKEQNPDLLPTALCEREVTTLGDEIEAVFHARIVSGETHSARRIICLDAVHRRPDEDAFGTRVKRQAELRAP
jgi:hypothetical protein